MVIDLTLPLIRSGDAYVFTVLMEMGWIFVFLSIGYPNRDFCVYLRLIFINLLHETMNVSFHSFSNQKS